MMSTRGMSRYNKVDQEDQGQNWKQKNKRENNNSERKRKFILEFREFFFVQQIISQFQKK